MLGVIVGEGCMPTRFFFLHNPVASFPKDAAILQSHSKEGSILTLHPCRYSIVWSKRDSINANTLNKALAQFSVRLCSDKFLPDLNCTPEIESHAVDMHCYCQSSTVLNLLVSTPYSPPCSTHPLPNPTNLHTYPLPSNHQHWSSSLFLHPPLYFTHS